MCLSPSAFECSMREAFKWLQEVACDLAEAAAENIST